MACAIGSCGPATWPAGAGASAGPAGEFDGLRAKKAPSASAPATGASNNVRRMTGSSQSGADVERPPGGRRERFTVKTSQAGRRFVAVSVPLTTTAPAETKDYGSGTTDTHHGPRIHDLAPLRR